MTEWIILTRGGAGGFYLDPTRTSHNISPRLSEILEVYSNIYGQLSSNADNMDQSQGIAILTMEYVQQANRWLVVLQGSGGSYGSSGTVQFALAPEDSSGATAWDSAYASLTQRHALTEEGFQDVQEAGLDTWLGLGFAEAIQPIVDVAAATDSNWLVKLHEGSIAVAWVISSLLRILPEPLRRGLILSTAYAPSNTRVRLRVVSGDWPEALRARHEDIYSRTWDKGVLVDHVLIKERLGLDWVVQEAEDGRFPGAGSQAQSVPEWLSDIESLRPWTTLECIERMERGLSLSDLRSWVQNGYSEQILVEHPQWLDILISSPYPEIVRDSLLSLKNRGQLQRLVAFAYEWKTGGIDWSLVRDTIGRDSILGLVRGVASSSKAGVLPGSMEPWSKLLGIEPEESPELFFASPERLMKDLRARRRTYSQAAEIALTGSLGEERVRRLLQLLSPEEVGRLLFHLYLHDRDLVGTSKRKVNTGRTVAQWRRARHLEEMLSGVAQESRQSHSDFNRFGFSQSIANSLDIRLGTFGPARTSRVLLLQFAAGIEPLRRRRMEWPSFVFGGLMVLALGLVIWLLVQ